MVIPLLIPVFSITAFLAVVFIATSVYWICWIIYTRTFHPLAKVPGPWIASVTRLWMIEQVRGRQVDTKQLELHNKYGPLVRIAPNEVICDRPEAIKQIYPTSNPLEKTDFYSTWNTKIFSKYPDMFSFTNEKLHSERRKIVNHVYSLTNVLKSEEYIDGCSELFMQKLNNYADNKKPCDLGIWLQLYAFDTVGELFFGRSFGAMEKGTNEKSLMNIAGTVMPVFICTALAHKFMRPFILFSSILNSSVRSALKAFEDIKVAVSDSIDERSKKLKSPDEEAPRRDMLQQLFDTAADKGEKLDFGEGEIKLEAYTAIFAGSDTTSVAMRAVFYHTMKNPTIYKKILSEIDEATKSNQLSHPITYTESINKLPYLNACIKEAMRIHPSVGLHLPRLSPKGGMVLCETFIPEGYHVAMNAAVVQFDRDVYGHDADVYRPERWLDGKLNTAEMERCMLQFGAGTRTCLGKYISLSMMYKVIPEILRKFDLEFVDAKKGWKVENMWFLKQTEFVVYVKRRLVTY